MVAKAEMNEPTLAATMHDLRVQYLTTEHCMLELASGKAAENPAMLGTCQ